MAKRYKVGDRIVWKDRPGRVRIMECTTTGMQEARRVNYLKYHPHEDLKGYRILQLDMNPWNFNEDNLVKVTVKEMNLLLNNRLLSKSDNYEINKSINAKSLLWVKSNIINNKVNEVINDEREH